MHAENRFDLELLDCGTEIECKCNIDVIFNFSLISSKLASFHAR